MGKLIIFEGPDGVGKTTLSNAISEYLNYHQRPSELMTFPGREQGTIGRLIYELHHNPSKYGIESLTDISKQALHIVAHLDAIERQIIPTLKTGKNVILDRFWWSTWVYGIVSEIEPNILKALIEVERQQWGYLQPDLAILIRRKTPINRDDSIEYWQRLGQEYYFLANAEKEKYPVYFFENDGSFEDAIQSIKNLLENYLNGK